MNIFEELNVRDDQSVIVEKRNGEITYRIATAEEQELLDKRLKKD